MIKKHDSLIPIILTDVADISRLSSHASLRHFTVKFIVTMVFMGENKGSQLNTVIPQKLGQNRLDKFS